MLRKPKLHKKAVALRRKGLSYNEILRYVSVGQSTISRWCCNILLTKNQKERLWRKRVRNPFILNLEKKALHRKKEANKWAKNQLEKISFDQKPLIITGIMLYWAEGTKFTSKFTIEFTNTDPRIIKMMMEFFRKVLKIKEDKFVITVRVRRGANVNMAKKYWSRITKLSKKNFRRPEILELNKGSKSLKKYPYGMCRIVVFDVLSYRKMAALIEEFYKKFLKYDSSP